MCVLCYLASSPGGHAAHPQAAPSHGKPTLGVDGVINHIAGTAWDLGRSHALTYGFRAGSLTPDQIKATNDAMGLWADVADIRLTRVGAGGSGHGAFTDKASILVSASTTGFVSGYAWTFSPGSKLAAAIDGDIFLNVSRSQFTDVSVGSYANMAIIHEVGHALGLTHPGAYNGSFRGYAQDAEYAQDSRQYTVMSYFSATNTGGSHGTTHAATPLLDDIAAIQSLYGANLNTRAGATVYGFHSNAGREQYSITSGGEEVVFAIWDGGGNDTLDLSGYTQSQVINLNAGAFSSVGGLIGNIAIARGVTIETAIGGSGSDRIFGNAAANVLIGGGGNDIVAGGGGDDRLVYHSGYDALNGGVGSDTAEFGRLGCGVLIDLAGGTAELFGGGAIASLSGIENVNGTAFDDKITGSWASNFIQGVAGADHLLGLAGDDVLAGGTGVDILDGGSGLDVASYWRAPGAVAVDLAGLNANTGEAGEDVLISIEGVIGSQLGDDLRGNDAANVLIGLGGDDRLDGQGGNDLLDGGSGGDVMSGGSGDDIYFVDSRFDVVVELAGGGEDLIQSSITLTLAPTIENGLLLGRGNVRLTGNAADNTLVGNDGANVIAGLGGRDIMTGERGADRFVFETLRDTGKTAATRDQITDFKCGVDRIDLSALDANGQAPGGAFKWLDQAEFTGDKGELRYVAHNGPGTAHDRTLIQGDINGDGRADFQIELLGVHRLDQYDFIL